MILLLISLSFLKFAQVFGEPSTPSHPQNSPSLGKEIFIPHSDENIDGEIVIPFNDPSTPETLESTTIPIIHQTTPMNPRFVGVIKKLPTTDTHQSSGCPNRIDAFTTGPDADYAFFETRLYIIRNNRIVDNTPISTQFLGAPSSAITGSLYDVDREMFILLSNRTVYGFKKHAGKWKLDEGFPKTLPESVAFQPDAIIRWHNKHQVLLSNGGKFALYDEYWNKSLLSGTSSHYFPNLPDHVRGISEFRNGKAYIFTKSLVFEYTSDRNSIIGGDARSLPEFWKC